MGTEPGCSFTGVSILTGTGSGQQMGKAEVQSGEGGHPAPGLTDLGICGADHALDNRLDYLRFAPADIGHEVKDLTGGQQPVIGRDQVLEGADCFASGMTKAGREQVGDAGSDRHGRVRGQARKGWCD